jgi:hypothetical protein
MITVGESSFLKSNVNSFVGLTLVASVAAWYGLHIWQAAGNNDPLAGALASALYEKQTIQALQN